MYVKLIWNNVSSSMPIEGALPPRVLQTIRAMKSTLTAFFNRKESAAVSVLIDSFSPESGRRQRRIFPGAEKKNCSTYA
jgi:hypothetical protein